MLGGKNDGVEPASGPSVLAVLFPAKSWTMSLMAAPRFALNATRPLASLLLAAIRSLSSIMLLPEADFGSTGAPALSAGAPLAPAD